MPYVSRYFPVHAHSEYSVLDGMGTVEDMVLRVAKLGQPAMALTDHGLMSGSLKLYKHARKAGILPFPGIEAYLVTDTSDDEAKKNRYHLGLIALDHVGYVALAELSSRSFTAGRRYYKPLIDLADLADLSAYGKHIAVTTGCRSGPVVKSLMTGGVMAARAWAMRLAKWFPHTFIEVQWHGIMGEGHGPYDDDGAIVSALLDIAHQTGLPVVLGQDSHYCGARDQIAHDLMKDICYGGDSDDKHFDGGPYHLADVSELIKPFEPSQWDLVEEGHEHLLGLNRMTMPAMDKYRFHVPNMGTTLELKRLVKRGMEQHGFELWAHYDHRAKMELTVIESLGYSNYFLLMHRILSWAKGQGIFFNARGSANGSLVCYVLGITQVDPVDRGISFDRFLSTDRQKPPDIDMDIESDRRAEVIAYTEALIPGTIPIGTFSKIGIFNDSMDQDDTRGSLIVQYHAAKRSQLGDQYTGKVTASDWPAIDQLAKISSRKSAGVHASGYVFPAINHPLDNYVPTMVIASSDTTVTQMVMEDVEDAGYVKGDFLGLRALKTMRLAMEAVGKDPVRDGMSWIPDDDKAACQVLRSGATAGVFQFEGYATLIGAKEMKVRNTYEAIACLALYRPAMLESGMTKRYNEAKLTKTPHQIHPGVDGICKDTWGVPVFQDQVIDIMRKCGLSYADLNDIIKAVKASGGKITEYAMGIFKRVHPVFIRAACTNLDDCDRSDAERIWQTVLEFREYGFNKAHATAYGLLAYRMAYMKVHHPTEFMGALLATWSGVEYKERRYQQEARRMGLQVGRPDINLSELVWTVDDKGILRKGLLSVKGCGESAAVCIVAERMNGGPYLSVDDLVARVPGRPVSGGKSWSKDGTLNGVLRALQDSGALNSVGLSPE